MDILTQTVNKGRVISIKKTQIPDIKSVPKDGDIEYFDPVYRCWIYGNIHNMSINVIGMINACDVQCSVWIHGFWNNIDGVRKTLTIIFPNYPNEYSTRSIRINDEKIVEFKKSF